MAIIAAEGPATDAAARQRDPSEMAVNGRSRYSRAAGNIQDHDLRLEYQAQDEDLASFHGGSRRDVGAPDQPVNGFSR